MCSPESVLDNILQWLLRQNQNIVDSWCIIFNFRDTSSSFKKFYKFTNVYLRRIEFVKRQQFGIFGWIIFNGSYLRISNFVAIGDLVCSHCPPHEVAQYILFLAQTFPFEQILCYASGFSNIKSFIFNHLRKRKIFDIPPCIVFVEGPL